MLKRNLICRMYPAAVLLLLIVSARAPAAVGKPYQTGKILDVEQKARSRVLYYLVNTPITKEDPYYEIRLQVKDTVFTAEYTPRHSADTVPAEWVADTAVEARVEKHYIFLEQPGGDEFELLIIKRKPAASVLKDSDPPSKP